MRLIHLQYIEGKYKLHRSHCPKILPSAQASQQHYAKMNRRVNPNYGFIKAVRVQYGGISLPPVRIINMFRARAPH